MTTTAEALQLSIYGIGAIGALPLVIVSIGALREARRKRKREAMLERWHKSIYS